MIRTLVRRCSLLVLLTLTAGATQAQPPPTPPPPPSDTSKLPTAKRRPKPQIIEIDPKTGRVIRRMTREQAARRAQRQPEKYRPRTTPKPVTKQAPLLVRPVSPSIVPLKPEEEHLRRRYPLLAGAIDPDRIRKRLDGLSGPQGAEFLYGELQRIFGAAVREERFPSVKDGAPIEGRNFRVELPGWDPADLRDGGRRLEETLRITADQKPAFAQLVTSIGPRAPRDAADRAETQRRILELLTPDQRGRWDAAQSIGRQAIILHAPYRVGSGEPAVAAAALLELAEAYKQFPPRRTVWLAATEDFGAGEGARELLAAHRSEFTPVGAVEGVSASLSQRAAWLVDLPGALRLGLAAVLILACLALVAGAVRRRSPGLALLGAVLLLPLAPLWLTNRFTPPRTATPLYLFASLSLDGSSGVPILADAPSDLQSAAAENAQRVAKLLRKEAAEVLGSTRSEADAAAKAWAEAGARTATWRTEKAGVPGPAPLVTDRQTQSLVCFIDHWLNDPNGAEKPGFPFTSPAPLKPDAKGQP